MSHTQHQLCALLLAAGYGTRLKETGRKTPKGLFKNQQQLSITDLALAAIKNSSQITDIALVSNQRFFDQYQTHLNSHHQQLKIKLLNDGSTESENRLGSLGDLVFALDQLNWWQKNVLVLPSDRTPENIIPQLIQLFAQHPEGFITCVSQESKQAIANKSGCAVLNHNHQIIEFEEKPAQPKSDYRALPFYIFPVQALKLLKKYQQSQQNMDSPGNIIPWLLEHHFPIYTYITQKNSFDIGDLQELAKFQQCYQATVD